MSRFVAALLVAALAVAGWRLLWFQCDDAFISFRYAHNLVAGHGPVWNPAPFLPVEGYTSPLWVLLLAGIWWLFGLEPPVCANWLALGCGLALLYWCATSLRALPWPDRLQRHRGWLVTLCLCTIAGNRTFATWLSSGMETSMFELWFCGWVLTAVRMGADAAPRQWRWLGATATLAALTRPEGYVCVAATVGLWLPGLRGPDRRQHLRALLWLLPVLIHLLWRRAYYGEWLPNTYYAKANEWWPEAGWRYLASFALEHGAWVWLLGVTAAAWVRRRRGRAAEGPSELASRAPSELPCEFPWLGRAAAAAALGVLLLFYGLRIGGDHFDYRPLASLVPLLAVHLLVALRSVDWPALGLAAAQLLLAAAASLGWVQYALTVDDPPTQFRPLAASAPRLLHPVLAEYDRWQAWLRMRAICIRSPNHAQVAAAMASGFRGRLRCPEAWPAIPIVYAAAVGVIGWHLPDVALLDYHGLNDWVVARTPIRRPPPPVFDDAVLDLAFAQCDGDHDGVLAEDELGEALAQFQPVYRTDLLARDAVRTLVVVLHDRNGDRCLDRREFDGITDTFAVHRLMAHEHVPPPEYLQDLPTDTRVVDGKLVITPRERPLDADAVRAIEQKWRARIGR